MKKYPTKNKASQIIGNIVERYPLAKKEREQLISIRMCLESEVPLWGGDISKSIPLFVKPSNFIQGEEKIANDRAYKRALAYAKKFYTEAGKNEQN